MGRTTKATATATTPAAEPADAVIDVAATAIVPVEEQETSALSRWDALAAEIAIASQQADGRSFDYHDQWGNKEARSYVAGLRRLKGKIERARKDAKAVHLERGRAVDATAKTLEAAVQGLIEPHEDALNAIAAAEEFRIAQHRMVLDRISALGDRLAVTTSAEAAQRLAELATIDTLALEEFTTAGANRLAEAIDGMEAHLADLQQREAEQAELEALRAEKAAREEAERLERIRQEAIAEERARAEREQEAERQRIEQERRDAQVAAERAQADAAARVEAARLAQEQAEARAAEAAAQAERLQAEAAEREQQRRAAEVAQAEREWQEAAEAVRLQEERRGLLRQQLVDRLNGTAAPVDPMTLIEILIDGQLHPAITIDWSRV